MFLFKRGGVYYVVYEDDGRRKWKSTHCRTKSDALRVLTQFKELLKTKPKSPLLSQFKTQFLAYAEQTYRPQTVELFRY